MNQVREQARALRLRIESGKMLESIEEAASHCVTFDDALTAFDGHTLHDAEGFKPTCCRRQCTVRAGWLGSTAKCEVCGAEIRDAVGPMSSPFLERGNSFVTTPSDKFIELFGERSWIVMHEGARP